MLKKYFSLTENVMCLFRQDGGHDMVWIEKLWKILPRRLVDVKILFMMPE